MTKQIAMQKHNERTQQRVRCHYKKSVNHILNDFILSLWSEACNIVLCYLHTPRRVHFCSLQIYLFSLISSSCSLLFNWKLLCWMGKESQFMDDYSNDFTWFFIVWALLFFAKFITSFFCCWCRSSDFVNSR